MKVLYIGGTGEISHACLHASAAQGHHCAVFNRGRSPEPLPPTVRQITGDLTDDAAYRALAREHFDVICQFKAYTLADVQRDLDTFSNHTAQYVFISPASAYHKPPTQHHLTEDTPLHNPYWPYSQTKADMEALLFRAHHDQQFPLTVVRPSHTLRTKFPGTFIPGDDHAWRMLHHRPVVIHGDGTALWTITHADDFAQPFSRLLGNPRALGQAFHITTHEAHPWNTIFQFVADALEVTPTFVHVPTDTLVRYNPDFAGPLLGDKAWSTTFDNTKVQSITGPFPPRISLKDALKHSAARFRRDRLPNLKPDPSLHALVDRIAADQLSLGVS